jgi:hypothetical protein
VAVCSCIAWLNNTVWVATPRTHRLQCCEGARHEMQLANCFPLRTWDLKRINIESGGRGGTTKFETRFAKSQATKTTGKLFSINRSLDQGVEGILPRLYEMRGNSEATNGHRAGRRRRTTSPCKSTSEATARQCGGTVHDTFELESLSKPSVSHQ